MKDDPQRLRVTRRSLAIGLGAAALTGLGRRSRAQTKPIRIGVISDQSGPYSAPGGPGSVVGARLAAEDFGNTVLGRPVEILIGDHQNKPDIGVGIAKRWLDVDGVDMITDGGSSAVALAIQDLTRERKKLFLITGSTSNEFTGKQCSPTGFQWQTDTYSTASAAVRAEISQGRKTFYFMIADYTFGYDLERFATAGIAAVR
jgi:branched-chain amino acid transport system substrate-binding protein